MHNIGYSGMWEGVNIITKSKDEIVKERKYSKGFSTQRIQTKRYIINTTATAQYLIFKYFYHSVLFAHGTNYISNNIFLSHAPTLHADSRHCHHYATTSTTVS